MQELPDSTHEEIKRLCAVGDQKAEQKAYSDALTTYWAAWDLLPEPKTRWEAATWILVAIGDANFLNADYVAGRDNLSTALHCPGAIGNPFIHLRLGQCQFELGNLDRAADELMRAYMGAGRDIFDHDDPKYLRFLSTRAKDIH
jgi:tetratricopeptide (TPR) repeat protein